MKIGFSVMAVLLSVGSTPDYGEAVRLMDEIERQVRLPEGAAPLQSYGRHYAFDEEGKVIGVYVLRAPPAPGEADYGCEEIRLDGEDLTSEPVPCPPNLETDGEVASGERQWFDDYRKLPHISDGGCMVVNVIFNLSRHRVEDTFCNGVA